MNPHLVEVIHERDAESKFINPSQQPEATLTNHLSRGLPVLLRKFYLQILKEHRALLPQLDVHRDVSPYASTGVTVIERSFPPDVDRNLRSIVESWHLVFLRMMTVRTHNLPANKDSF